MYVLLVALALLLHDMLGPYSVDADSGFMLDILTFPGYALVKTPIFLVGGRQAWGAFEAQTHGFLGPVMGLNGLLCVGLAWYLDLGQKAQALYALACLLGLLSMMVWLAPFGRHLSMRTWGSFAVVYPIAAVLMIMHRPADATSLRNPLLVPSLVLLLLVWLVSSSVALALLYLGPDFR